MKNLNDLTVVITGASSGMGLAAAHAFARRGANAMGRNLQRHEIRPRRFH
ncbi:MAG: hypothetical protein ACJ8AQ_01840 [Gemmatimonadales bacterium]